jgi:hypothetical protein
MNFKPKACVKCGDEYLPTGRCSKWCPTCKVDIKKEQQLAGQYKHRRKLGMRIGRGSLFGELGSSYKHGKSTFDRWARERAAELNACEECGKDLSIRTQWNWVGHHKDHNKLNNTKDNLVILCKRCHQIEHQCWKAFEGATTISKESRADNSSKRPPSQVDDDIV